MLRDFNKVTKSELNYFYSHEIHIYEKLDMFYFNVIVMENGCTILKSNHHIIDKIDCIVNSVYTDISNFVNKYIIANKPKILKNFGECIVGFFYCPVEQPFMIAYKNSPCVGKFILSNIKSLITNETIKVDQTDSTYFAPESVLCTYPEIVSLKFDSLNKDTYLNIKSIFVNYIKGNITGNECISTLLKAVSDIVKEYDEDFCTTFTKIPESEIEGIVIKFGKYSFQILNKEPEQIDAPPRLHIYDELIKDFLNWYVLSDNDISIEDDYITTVSKLFINYVNSADFPKNYKGSPDNFLPAITSYTADLDYNLINNDTVKVLCKYNELFKNIYRIFIHNLRYTKNVRPSQFLNEDDFALWNEIVNKINPVY